MAGTFLALAMIVIVAAGLRTQRLAEIAYWFDESFCVKMAEFSPAEIWTRSGRDTHPPLYFLLLKFWGLLFGTSPVALRLFSSALGTGAVVGVFLFVREAYLPRPGDERESPPATLVALVAAVFVALSPIHIVWSLQVRMYVLGTALTAFSSWFLMRALRREPPRRVDWCLYTLTAILLAYTHHYGLFTVAAQILFAASDLGRPSRASAEDRRIIRLKPLILSAASLAIGWLAWLPSLRTQSEKVSDNFWTKPLSWDLWGTTFFQLFNPDQAPFQKETPSITAGLAVMQGAVLGLAVLLLGRRPADRYIALAASLPFVAATLVSLGPRGIIVPRYLQFAHLFLLAAAAVLICRIPPRPFRAMAIMAAIAGMATLSWPHYQGREELAKQPGMQDALSRFSELRGKDEPLIVSHPQIFLSVVPYLPNRNGVFAHKPKSGFAFSDGSPVMRDEDYLTTEALSQSDTVSVWTLDAGRFKNMSWVVPMPDGWRQSGETRFTEYYYGELLLRLYVRDNARKSRHQPLPANRATDDSSRAN
jgi:hypothetical protein